MSVSEMSICQMSAKCLLTNTQLLAKCFIQMPVGQINIFQMSNSQMVFHQKAQSHGNGGKMDGRLSRD
jgi:hypothetical protein